MALFFGTLGQVTYPVYMYTEAYTVRGTRYQKTRPCLTGNMFVVILVSMQYGYASTIFWRARKPFIQKGQGDMAVFF